MGLIAQPGWDGARSCDHPSPLRKTFRDRPWARQQTYQKVAPRRERNGKNSGISTHIGRAPADPYPLSNGRRRGAAATLAPRSSQLWYSNRQETGVANPHGLRRQVSPPHDTGQTTTVRCILKFNVCSHDKPPLRGDSL